VTHDPGDDVASPTFAPDGSYPYPPPGYDELMRSSGGWPTMPPTPEELMQSGAYMQSGAGWPGMPPTAPPMQPSAQAPYMQGMPPGMMPPPAAPQMQAPMTGYPPGMVPGAQMPQMPMPTQAAPMQGMPTQAMPMQGMAAGAAAFDPQQVSAAWPAAAAPPAPASFITPATQALLQRLPAPPPEPRYFGRNRAPADDHRDVTGGWLRAAVFGAMDGVVTNASLIAGATGAHAANHTIILTGLAGLVAGAFSMATGEYISVTSQNEVTIAEVDSEREEHEINPGRELAELAEVFMGKGVEPTLALEVARQLSEDPEQALNVHAREELGVDPDDLPSPWTAASASFAAFTVGALTPLLPYLIGLKSFGLALALAGAFAFGGGAVVANAAKRPAMAGGIRQLALGALATGMTFLVGQLVGAQVG
jgi:vacuolar iron transporter family protein